MSILYCTVSKVLTLFSSEWDSLHFFLLFLGKSAMTENAWLNICLDSIRFWNESLNWGEKKRVCIESETAQQQWDVLPELKSIRCYQKVGRRRKERIGLFLLYLFARLGRHTRFSVSFLFLACFPFYQDSNIRRRNCCCNRPTVIWVVSPSFLLKKQNKGYVMQSILARRRAACIVVTRDCVRVWFSAEGGKFYTLSSSCRPQQPIAATCSLPCQQQNIRKGSKGWV